MLKPKNNKKGFTIIEVVLVLAIAGLIFMAVFIALPALQRSQRDTRRKQDVSRVVAQLQSYQSNNRSRLPGEAADSNGSPKTGNVTRDMIKDNVATNTWEYFYKNYLISEDSDDFADPNGDSYSLKVVDTDAALPASFKEQASADPKYAIMIHLGFQCDGEDIKAATGGKRKVAVRYRGESGNVICQNN